MAIQIFNQIIQRLRVKIQKKSYRNKCAKQIIQLKAVQDKNSSA